MQLLTSAVVHLGYPRCTPQSWAGAGDVSLRGHWEEDLSDKQESSHPHLPSPVPLAFLAGPAASLLITAWTTAGAPPGWLSVETGRPHVVSHQNATLPELEPGHLSFLWQSPLATLFDSLWTPFLSEIRPA